MSGNENHGELQGGEWVEGPSGPALSLNGQNDRVIIADSDSLYLEKAWTITAWTFVNPTENGFGHILGKRPASGTVANYAFRTSGNGTGWEAYYSRGGWKGAWNQGSVKKDVWLYMTATYDGEDTIKIYENGAEIGSVSGMVWNRHLGMIRMSTSAVGQTTLQRHLTVCSYEVALFDVALAEADINDLMEDGIPSLLTAVEPSGKLATTWASIKSQ